MRSTSPPSSKESETASWRKTAKTIFLATTASSRSDRMWWNQPRLRDFPPLLPDNILDVAVRSYAVAEVGGLSGYGPERGRNFEKLFYGICDRRGVHLTEKAG